MSKRLDLSKLRERLGGISQAELGRRLGGVDQSTISRWETGVVDPDGPAGVLLAQLDEEARKAPAER